MRKLIWGCAAGGALVVCGAFAAADHAVRHPQSFIGRALHGASHLAACANPYHGFAPVLARLRSANDTRKDEVAIDVEGLPADPAPSEGPEAPVAPGPIEAPKDAPPIVIPEADRPVPPADLPDEVEVPAGEGPAAPATMPPAGDAEENELPVPSVEEEVECRSWWQALLGWFQAGAACGGKAVTEATELPETKAGGVGECREDKNYHHHYPGCPYTGRSYPGCKGGQPAAMPPLPMKGQGGEEPSEEGAKPSALKTIRKIRGRAPLPEDGPPVAPGVDTMELRKSDLPLYDYGPGPL